jgi:hypothetical protein
MLKIDGVSAFFTKLTTAWNNSNGLKEGGSVRGFAEGLGLSIQKEPDVVLRGFSYDNVNGTIKTWDMRGFRSAVICINASYLNDFEVTGSSDNNIWVPVRIQKISGYDSDYPLVPYRFRPEQRNVCYAVVDCMPFLRIRREAGITNTTSCALIVIALSNRIPDLTIKPFSFYPLSARVFNPTTAVTSSAEVDVTIAPDGTTPAASKYLITRIRLTNEGATGSQVRLLSGVGSTVIWSGFVNANSTLTETFELFPAAVAGEKVRISVSTAGATIHPMIHFIRAQA